MKTKLHMRVWLWMTAAGLLVPLAGAEEFNNIEYLCCDWGPAMTLPGKTNAAPQFSDTEEEVYFVKQVNSFVRKKTFFKDIFSGRDHEDVGKGLSIWLCKMKADGSGKTEIKELWKNPAFPIDTSGQSAWMDVNKKTHTIALSITYAGSDLTGLWVVSMDGTKLKRIMEPGVVENRRRALNHPSWTPDGLWIVFEEGLRGTAPERAWITRCDRNGANQKRLTGGPDDREPGVSPDGARIAFIHREGWASLLWVMNADSTNAHPLPNPEDKRQGRHGGTYPAWSPDGRRILASGCVIDLTSGRTLVDRMPQYQGKPYTYGWAHWGKAGIAGFSVGGILFTDSDLKEAKWIGSSRLVSLSASKPDAGRW